MNYRAKKRQSYDFTSKKNSKNQTFSQIVDVGLGIYTSDSKNLMPQVLGQQMRMKIQRRKKSIDQQFKQPMRPTHTIKFTGILPSNEIHTAQLLRSHSNSAQDNDKEKRINPQINEKQSPQGMIIAKSVNIAQDDESFRLLDAIVMTKEVRKRNVNNQLSSHQHSKRHTVKLLDSKEQVADNQDLEDAASEIGKAAMASMINHKEPYVGEQPYIPTKKVSQRHTIEGKSEASSMKQISFKEFQSLKSSTREIEESFINFENQQLGVIQINCRERPQVFEYKDQSEIIADVNSQLNLTAAFQSHNVVQSINRLESKKLSNEIASFIGQYNRKMRPLSHIKRSNNDHRQTPIALLKTQVFNQSLQESNMQAQKDLFKKGILSKIKEHESREKQYYNSQNAVNTLLHQLKSNQTPYEEYHPPYLTSNLNMSSSAALNSRRTFQLTGNNSQNKMHATNNPRQRLYSAHIKSKSTNQRLLQQPIKAMLIDDDATTTLIPNKNSQSICSSIIGSGWQNNVQGTIEEQFLINVSSNKHGIAKHQRNTNMRSSTMGKNIKNRQISQSEIDNKLSDKPFIISSYIFQGLEDEFTSTGNINNKIISLLQEDPSLSISNINYRRSQSMLGQTQLLINGQRAGNSNLELQAEKQNFQRPHSPFIQNSHGATQILHQKKRSRVSSAHPIHSRMMGSQPFKNMTKIIESNKFTKNQQPLLVIKKSQINKHNQKDHSQLPLPLGSQIFQNQSIVDLAENRDKPIRNLIFTNIDNQCSPSMSLMSKSPMVSDGGHKNMISIRRYSNSLIQNNSVDGKYILSSREDTNILEPKDYKLYNPTNESSKSLVKVAPLQIQK